MTTINDYLIIILLIFIIYYFIIIKNEPKPPVAYVAPVVVIKNPEMELNKIFIMIENLSNDIHIWAKNCGLSSAINDLILIKNNIHGESDLDNLTKKNIIMLSQDVINASEIFYTKYTYFSEKFFEIMLIQKQFASDNPDFKMSDRGPDFGRIQQGYFKNIMYAFDKEDRGSLNIVKYNNITKVEDLPYSEHIKVAYESIYQLNELDVEGDGVHFGSSRDPTKNYYEQSDPLISIYDICPELSYTVYKINKDFTKTKSCIKCNDDFKYDYTNKKCYRQKIPYNF